MCSPWAVTLLGEYGRLILCIRSVLQPHPGSTGEGAGSSLCSSLSVMETALSSIQSIKLCILYFLLSLLLRALVEKAGLFMQTDGKMLIEIHYKKPGSCLSHPSNQGTEATNRRGFMRKAYSPSESFKSNQNSNSYTFPIVFHCCASQGAHSLKNRN